MSQGQKQIRDEVRKCAENEIEPVDGVRMNSPVSVCNADLFMTW